MAHWKPTYSKKTHSIQKVYEHQHFYFTFIFIFNLNAVHIAIQTIHIFTPYITHILAYLVKWIENSLLQLQRFCVTAY